MLYIFYNETAYVLSEHMNVCLNNFEIGDKYIRFEENMLKTFHGSLLDLKYEPDVM